MICAAVRWAESSLLSPPPPPCCPAVCLSVPWRAAAGRSCEYCTLDNHPELEVCEACGNHRVKSTGHRVQEDQLRIMKEARRISPRGLPTARAGGSR